MNTGLEATITVAHAASTKWDAVVIGAGPAGSIAAWRLVSSGLRTLLLDRVAPPRAKVCGCCIAPGGIRTLQAIGLEGAMQGAVPLSAVRVFSGKRVARLPIRGYAALGRDVLDFRLAMRALEAGADALWGASARVTPGGRVRITEPEGDAELRASMVVVADGLNGTSLRDFTDATWTIRPGSRMGAGALLADAPLSLARGEVAMLCERSGYLGIVRLPDGRCDLAGAFDPEAVRLAGGPAQLAGEYLARAGGDPAAALGARWKATGLLSRTRSSVEWDGTIVIGDAAGYVEPFTGEGMTWAIESALESAAHAAALARGAGSPGQWTRNHHRLLRRRHWRCSVISAALRRPAIVRSAQMVIQASPRIAGALVGLMCSPSHDQSLETA